MQSLCEQMRDLQMFSQLVNRGVAKGEEAENLVILKSRAGFIYPPFFGLVLQGTPRRSGMDATFEWRSYRQRHIELKLPGNAILKADNSAHCACLSCSK